MHPYRKWGIAWVALVAAFALHVVDEATTGFLPLYNAVVSGWRESYDWVPLPVFTFDGWLAMLITVLLVLFALSPLAFAGKRGLRPLAWFFSIVMLANGIAHLAISAAMGEMMPGAWSSPVLIVAAIALIVTTGNAAAEAR